MNLKHPIDLGEGKTLSKITLGKFKVKHLKLIPPELSELAVDKEKMNTMKKNSQAYIKAEKQMVSKATLLIPKLIPLLASLTDQPVDILEEMEIDDFFPMMDRLYTILGEVMPQAV